MNYKGNRGIEIAKLIWPNIELEPEGSFFDCYGIDGIINGETLQIKYDSRISQSRNIYHEIYEKSDNNPNQPWRKSPGIATQYIFSTENNVVITGYLISVDTLAIAERNKPLRLIKPNNHDETSMGFILPISELSEMGVVPISKLKTVYA